MLMHLWNTSRVFLLAIPSLACYIIYGRYADSNIISAAARLPFILHTGNKGKDGDLGNFSI
jgi:hypothetical protein